MNDGLIGFPQLLQPKRETTFSPFVNEMPCPAPFLCFSGRRLIKGFSGTLFRTGAGSFLALPNNFPDATSSYLTGVEAIFNQSFLYNPNVYMTNFYYLSDHVASDFAGNRVCFFLSSGQTKTVNLSASSFIPSVVPARGMTILFRAMIFSSLSYHDQIIFSCPAFTWKANERSSQVVIGPSQTLDAVPEVFHRLSQGNPAGGIRPDHSFSNYALNVLPNRVSLYRDKLLREQTFSGSLPALSAGNYTFFEDIGWLCSFYVFIPALSNELLSEIIQRDDI